MIRRRCSGTSPAWCRLIIQRAVEEEFDTWIGRLLTSAALAVSAA